MSPTAELLWFSDCPNHLAARAMLEEVIAEVAPGTPIRDIDATDPATAVRVRFPGSPTIRVDGRDVDPGYIDPGDYTPRCRLYRTSAGLGGLPERSWIEDALRGGRPTGSRIPLPTHGASLAAAFDSRDLERLVELLDVRVTWRGLPQQDGYDSEQEHGHDDDHDHGPPLCTDRDQVRGVFEAFLVTGGTGFPIVIAEVGDTVIVDPRTEPPRPFPLHQAFTFRGDRVVLIQDYADRASALAAIGL